jgi:hypothetical protein
MDPIRQSSTDFTHPLGHAWEGAVKANLRDLTDADLLRLLAEIDRQEDDTGSACDPVFTAAPDWDALTEEDLDLVAGGFEAEIAARAALGGTCSEAVPVKAPLRRRHRPAPARLSFEELESRYSPSALTLGAAGRAAVLPCPCARWQATDVRPAAAWQAAAPAAVAGGVPDHVWLQFDTVVSDATALSDVALAQVA